MTCISKQSPDKDHSINFLWTKRKVFLFKVLSRGLLVVFILTSGLPSALACGWWGDSEGDDDDAIVIGADGKPVSEGKTTNHHVKEGVQEAAAVQGLEVPAPKSGYGILVRQNGSAVPYLHAVGGRRVTSIQELRQTGFSAVIDLGTAPKTSILHRRETEALGMKYFTIPVAGDTPGKVEVAQFHKILSDRGNLPILVFSASANLLGGMWAYHRLMMGVAQKIATQEGYELGLSKHGARDLENRISH
jgi:protein tyrosine phosphatase (PTP) superfamily phosphohydrolase (DUF442 family)